MSKTAKIITSIILSVVMLFSAMSFGLYIMIEYFLPEKMVDITVNASTLKNVENEDEKWIIDVEYWSNHLNNGVELLDIQFNNYMDIETAEQENPIVYGKGIQIVGNAENSISFDKVYSPVDIQWFTSYHRSHYVSNFDVYYYDSSNGVSFQSVRELDSKYLFRVSVGDDLYAMMFTNYGKPYNEYQLLLHHHICYLKYDINYFAYQIYNKIVNSNSVGYGANGQLMIDMSDNFNAMFKYKKYSNGAFVGDWLQASSEMNNKLITEFNNYFTIRLKTHESGATNARYTKFGMVAGDSNFEIVDSGYAENYFNGVQSILLNEYNFSYTQFSDYGYYADLSFETKQYLEKHKDNDIKVLIDIDNLKEHLDFENLEYRISDTYKPKIKSFLEIKTVDGERAYSEVVL